MRTAHSRWLLVHGGVIHTHDPLAPRATALLALGYSPLDVERITATPIEGAIA